jgi:hypothetical protein
MGSGKRGAARQAQRGAVPDPVILEFRFRPAEDAADATGEAARREDLTTRADLARCLNAAIYRVGQSLSDSRDPTFELTFFCGCGCMAEVRRTPDDFVTRGALVPGHSRLGDHSTTS